MQLRPRDPRSPQTRAAPSAGPDEEPALMDELPDGDEPAAADPAAPELQVELRPDEASPTAARLLPGHGPLPSAASAPAARPQIRLTPRDLPGANAPPVPEPAPEQGSGGLAGFGRRAGLHREERALGIDLELVPAELVARTEAELAAQEAAALAYRARNRRLTQLSALTFAGGFALGSVLMAAHVLGAWGLLTLALFAGTGAATGAWVGQARPNRLVAAVGTWLAAFACGLVQLSVAVGLHGLGSLALAFPGLVGLMGLAASGGFLSAARLELLEQDQLA